MMLLAYLELHFPGSDMENQAQLLHSHLEQLEPTEAETRDGEDPGWVVWVSGECMGLGHTEKSFQKLGLGRIQESLTSLSHGLQSGGLPGMRS